MAIIARAARLLAGANGRVVSVSEVSVSEVVTPGVSLLSGGEDVVRVALGLGLSLLPPPLLGLLSDTRLASLIIRANGQDGSANTRIFYARGRLRVGLLVAATALVLGFE
jgi:hypothetical protein